MKAGVALSLLAHATRRFHPRGTDRLLRRIHHPDKRTWSITDVVTLQNGFRLHVDTASFLEWRAFFYGEYEPETAALLERAVRPGRAAVDVGANVGIHTLALARTAETVYAFEPSPAIARRLHANLALNGISNVSVHELALADREGEFHVPSGALQGSASLAPDSPHGSAESSPVSVRTARLDDFGLSKVDLIKIDVEGYEGAVLAGARQLLARDRPTLVFEYAPELWALAGYELEAVLDDLRPLGYEFSMIEHGTNVVASAAANGGSAPA